MGNDNRLTYDDQGRIVIQSYDQKRPFSSFLPGIGGLFGIPIWAFYNNRGQAMTSFGIESKDHPILEFQPANKAYALTATTGFRTFLKADHWTCEPFSPWCKEPCQRDMHIGMNEVEIVEKNPVRGLETRVLYFNITNEDFAALARVVTFRNNSQESLKFEVLDGLPALIPYGVNNEMLKFISRTIEAWMRVTNINNRVPYFTLKMSAEDTSEVTPIEGGNFALGFSGGELLPTFVDPAVLFGSTTEITFPTQWHTTLFEMGRNPQILEGRTPCCYFGGEIEISPNEDATIASVYGYVHKFEELIGIKSKIVSDQFLKMKRTEAQKLINDLTAPAMIRSGDPVFDSYARQSFLDNVIRGGRPEVVGDNSIYHVFSRKHGDPERDYNNFYLSPEYYSQGNGNFRDVNQNRRDEVFFNPLTGDFNIRLFMSLIQLDGYNPLVVKGTKFSVQPEAMHDLLEHVGKPELLEDLLAGQFSPGDLLRVFKKSDLKISEKDLFYKVMAQAEQHIQAEHGEGFWIDHWTYNLDLIESYLAIYPEKKGKLLFDSDTLPFFDNLHFVHSRNKKYVLVNGKPRQQHAIGFNKEKVLLMSGREDDPDWARMNFGVGEIFRVSLFSKLVMLAVIKFSTLDPYGMGIEMEAGRPGWCDALNGLPSLFGSSLPETMELIRLVDFILHTISETPHPTNLPIEMVDLLENVLRELKESPTEFAYWDAVSNLREDYRQATMMGVSGEIIPYSADDLIAALTAMKAKLWDGVQSAIKDNDGIPPTYFYYDLVDYVHTGEEDEFGNPIVKPKGFKQHRLPLYLEGPVRYAKLLDTQSEVRKIYEKIKQSDLYDRKLKMYRLNASLHDETFEIGRARVFTPGWLENESIWLHMSYKYLLAILQAGLYKEFFADMQTNMPPYMDAAIYGRSPTENSSFIVSSVHPDPALHGAGFVARLTGSTAEFLSMLLLMLVGPSPFYLDNQDNLILKFQPVLPGDFFDEKGALTFRFLGHCDIIYKNPGRRDTFSAGTQIRTITLQLPNGSDLILEGDHIPAPYSEMIRDGRITKLELFIS